MTDIRPSTLYGVTTRVRTPFGNVFITMNSDSESIPYEVFITIGKAGSDLRTNAQAMSHLISTCIQVAPIQDRKVVIEKIVNQLTQLRGRSSYVSNNTEILSLPDAVSQAMNKHWVES